MIKIDPSNGMLVYVQSGGSDTSDGNISPSTVLDGYIGYNSAGRVVGSIPVQGSESYTVGSDGLVISSGVYLGGNQTVGISSGYYNTSDATITSDNVLSGYVGYGASGAVTGNIASLGAQTYTPGSQSITISAGVYLAGDQVILPCTGVDVTLGVAVEDSNSNILFQKLSFNGTEASDSGAPQSVSSLKSYNTGHPAPSPAPAGSGLVYGVLYDPNDSSPVCQRVVLTGNQLKEVPCFSYMPAHNFRRCVMDNLAARHINYYLSPFDSNYKQDGTAAVLTGADGDVMVEIPITYWKVDTTRADGKILYLVSDKPFAGSEPHPFFYVSPGGATLRKQYVGAFHSVLCDGDGVPLTTSVDASASAAYAAGRKARSVVGAKPFTKMGQATHRTAAANNGAYGINSLFKQYILLMMAIEGGSFNIRETISQGFIYAKAFDYRFTRLSGRTANFGNMTGSVFYDASAGDGNVGFYRFKVDSTTYCRYQDGDTASAYAWRESSTVIYTASATPSNGDTAYTDSAMTTSLGTISSYTSTDPENQVVACTYRGIENPYGEIWEFEDGAVADAVNGYLYHTPDVLLYSDSTYLTTYIRDEHTWPQTNFVKTFDEKTFFAKTSGGNKTTYLCEYFRFKSGSAQVIQRGGSLSDGEFAGINLYYTFGVGYPQIGARIAV